MGSPAQLDYIQALANAKKSDEEQPDDVPQSAQPDDPKAAQPDPKAAQPADDAVAPTDRTHACASPLPPGGAGGVSGSLVHTPRDPPAARRPRQELPCPQLASALSVSVR